MWYTYICIHTHTIYVYIHIHKIEYYSALKKNEILPFVTMWMGLEGIMLSEIDRERCCCCCLVASVVSDSVQTPQTAAHQAPPSLGFSRQEHWSGLPLPSPMHESESQSEVAQSCLTLRDAMDCSLPGSSVHGIFQARVLELGCHCLLQEKDEKDRYCILSHIWKLKNKMNE